MALRRPRVHSTGISNLDCRTQLEWKQLRASKSPLHTSKRQYFQECLGVAIPTRPHPDLNRTSASITQENYYKSANRRVNRPVDRVSTAPISGQNPFLGGDNSPFIKFPERSAFPAPVANKTTALIQALQSRYAQHTALQTVFSRWDRKGKGVIGTEDVVLMGNELGVGVGEKEAEAFVALVDKRKTGGVNYDDFVELIREEGSALAGNISPIKLRESNAFDTDKRAKRLQDQLKGHMQGKLTVLTGKFSRRDKARTGLVSRQAFCEVLNDLGLSYAFSNPQTWLALYSQAGGSDSGIDYKALLRTIEACSPLEKPENKGSEQASESAKDTKEGKSIILDPQRVPVNRVESILTNSRRVCRLLKAKFPTETALRAHIQSASPTSQLSQGFLKALIEETAKEMPDLKLRKEEIDNFLSRFIYNRQQETSISVLIQSLYQAEDLVEDSLQHRVRVEPTIPPDQASKADSKPDISNVLKSLEERLFVGNGLSSFQAFKRLDVDRDGFMTMEDLTNGLLALHIPHNQLEARALMDALDTAGKGWVDYKQFARVVRPDTLQDLASQKEQGSSAAQPSLAFLSTQLAQSKDTNESFARERSRNMDGGLTRGTRFSSTPQHHNTFLHYHPEATSPLYISEKDRLVSKRITPLNLSAEESIAKQQLRSAKANRYREVISSVNDSLSQATAKAAQLDANRLTQLAAFREDYERVRPMQRCHLQSAL